MHNEQLALEFANRVRNKTIRSAAAKSLNAHVTSFENEAHELIVEYTLYLTVLARYNEADGVITIDFHGWHTNTAVRHVQRVCDALAIDYKTLQKNKPNYISYP